MSSAKIGVLVDGVVDTADAVDSIDGCGKVLSNVADVDFFLVLVLKKKIRLLLLDWFPIYFLPLILLKLFILMVL